jgi:hypothetical protein
MGDRKRVQAGLTGFALLVLAGCAAVPPEREERDRQILAAIQPCKEKYSYILGYGPMYVLPSGVVRFWYNDTFGNDALALASCMNEAAKDLRRGPYKPGELARPGPARVPVTAASGEILAPVRVNGVLGSMAVNMRAPITSLTPAFAKRAGLNVVAESPTAFVRVRDKTVEIPYARARALEVGDASVGPLDVAVYEALPDRAMLDGVLGWSFLQHFRVNVDRPGNQLILEPRR